MDQIVTYYIYFNGDVVYIRVNLYNDVLVDEISTVYIFLVPIFLFL